MLPVLNFHAGQEWTPELLAELLGDSPDLDWRRFEIVDGALVVSPTASRLHELVVTRLSVALSAVCPEGFVVLGSAAIGIGRSYRITDVTMLAEHLIRSPESTLSGHDVLLGIEIESPSSITTDRITKPAQYAEAGMTHYWRVETDPMRLIAYRLDGDTYVQVGSWGTGEVARISEPVAVEIDISTLSPA